MCDTFTTPWRNLLFSGKTRKRRSDSDPPGPEEEPFTAFGLQIDEADVVTFSFAVDADADVEDNKNGFICEADGAFWSFEGVGSKVVAKPSEVLHGLCVSVYCVVEFCFYPRAAL